MALAASPPPAANYDQMNDDLDEDIQSIRAEIQEMTKRRKLLSATLLASATLQNQLKSQIDSSADDLPQDITPLLAHSQQHAETNLHRLAYGVTAFPFQDPNPETSSKRLIGVRIDVCNRAGRFEKPYYLLCRRVDETGNDLRIHRHTIPVFIPLQDYEEQYLPLQDEGYGSEQSIDGHASPKQDLHGLVQKVRHDLLSWTLRREAIDLLREELDLQTDAEEAEDGDHSRQDSTGRSGKFGVRSISPVSVEAKYAKIVWEDGRAGRVKISDHGLIERAVVIGEEGRVRNAERVLTEGSVSIGDLTQKLEILDQEV